MSTFGVRRPHGPPSLGSSGRGRADTARGRRPRRHRRGAAPRGLALFSSVAHNGWLTYQGGDQMWLVTAAGSSLTERRDALTSHGWPVLVAP